MCDDKLVSSPGLALFLLVAEEGLIASPRAKIPLSARVLLFLSLLARSSFPLLYK